MRRLAALPLIALLLPLLASPAIPASGQADGKIAVTYRVI